MLRAGESRVGATSSAIPPQSEHGANARIKNRNHNQRCPNNLQFTHFAGNHVRNEHNNKSGVRSGCMAVILINGTDQSEAHCGGVARRVINLNNEPEDGPN